MGGGLADQRGLLDPVLAGWPAPLPGEEDEPVHDAVSQVPLSTDDVGRLSKVALRPAQDNLGGELSAVGEVPVDQAAGQTGGPGHLVEGDPLGRPLFETGLGRIEQPLPSQSHTRGRTS